MRFNAPQMRNMQHITPPRAYVQLFVRIAGVTNESRSLRHSQVRASVLVDVERVAVREPRCGRRSTSYFNFEWAADGQVIRDVTSRLSCIGVGCLASFNRRRRLWPLLMGLEEAHEQAAEAEAICPGQWCCRCGGAAVGCAPGGPSGLVPCLVPMAQIMA